MYVDLVLKCNYTDIDQDIPIKKILCMPVRAYFMHNNFKTSQVYKFFFLYRVGNYCNWAWCFYNKKCKGKLCKTCWLRPIK